MAIRYHLRLMAVVVNNIRILLIGCAVFLCGLSYADVEEEDSGALRIETETEEYSADIYLGNTDDRKADRERKTIGVGERITLTLTGKPLGNVKEIEWKAEENGEEYVEMPQKTRGELSITVTARKRLRQGGFAVIQAITSEGRKVKTTLNVVIPSEIRAEHKNGGTATESLPEGLTAVIGASAVLKLTLYPTSVNFKNVRIIERDKGSVPPGTDFDPGHSRNGANEAAKVSETNQLEDNVTGGIFAADVEHSHFPQSWDWVCSWRIHDGEGGEGTEHLDGCEIMEVRCHFSFSEFYRQEIWGPQRYHLVTISKFGCCVEQDTVTYRNKYYYHHESVR